MRVDCQTCHGAGRVEFGESGSYYRDGEKYDPPGYETCDDCGGFGWVEVEEEDE